ncbi:MAG: hypothetical protein ABJN34_08170 [Litoreibacter sp.]|uniref:hypothetical protein n=1 Tax=Litoreibacter sp. TaxID=1969459 RepID=UPI00329924AF
MINYFFAICAGVSGLILLLHMFAGSPNIANPMRNCEELHPVVRETNYYCWHLVSISLLQLSISFGWAAIAPSAYLVAVIAVFTAFAFSIWGMVLVVTIRQKFQYMPQGLLFLPLALIGLAGLLQ